MKRHHQDRLQLEKKFEQSNPRTTKQTWILSKERTKIDLAIGWLTKEQSVANRFQQ